MDETGISLQTGRPHWGTWGGGSVYRELGELAERGLWPWRIHLYGRSVGETWKCGSFVGGPEGYERRLLEWASLFMRAQLGNLE